MIADEEVAEAKDQSGRIDSAEDEVRPGDETRKPDFEGLAAGEGLAVDEKLEIRALAYDRALSDDVIFVIGGGITGVIWVDLVGRFRLVLVLRDVRRGVSLKLSRNSTFGSKRPELKGLGMFIGLPPLQC